MGLEDWKAVGSNLLVFQLQDGIGQLDVKTLPCTYRQESTTITIIRYLELFQKAQVVGIEAADVVYAIL